MKLGMIGFGNMAAAMLEGLLLKNTICPGTCTYVPPITTP